MGSCVVRVKTRIIKLYASGLVIVMLNTKYGIQNRLNQCLEISFITLEIEKGKAQSHRHHWQNFLPPAVLFVSAFVCICLPLVQVGIIHFYLQ